ncbi:MAG: hypothetical protein OEW60_06665 [Thiovulaceae bacterium]|nr:hypothetical protein [Sulfurimonadaceae bacterium]
MIDAYEALIPEYLSQEDFIRYGLEKTVYIPDDKVKEGWEDLKKQINSNKKVFMRGVKDNNITRMFFDYYKDIVKNERIAKDPSNTQNPAKVIEDLSGIKKSKDLRNYQLTSIFGRSRNIFAFTAPWNIVYIPNLIDPLLSSEANNELSKEFQKAFQKNAYEKFKPYVDEFNKIVTDHHFRQSTDDYFEHLYNNNRLYPRENTEKFEEIYREDFAPIEVS